MTRHGWWLALVALGCTEVVVPPTPDATLATQAEARAAMDAAALAVTRATQALWRLGGRDVVSPVYLDTLTPPIYVRLTRGAP